MSHRPPRVIVEVVETLALTLVVFLAVQAWVAQPFQIRQSSMEQTLAANEFVLVDKLTTRFGPYHRGDIVVLQAPEGWQDAARTPFIKRVIGLPGDRVEIGDDGLVYVNGEALDETAYTYRDESGVNEPTLPQGGDTAWTLGEDELFVLGDHRAASEDSRAFGPIPVASVVGRAFLRYWPASTFGVLARPDYP